jgi:hypothetical protein
VGSARKSVEPKGVWKWQNYGMSVGEKGDGKSARLASQATVKVKRATERKARGKKTENGKKRGDRDSAG